MQEKTQLLVATSKGLVIYRYNGRRWVFEREEFLGLRLTQVYVDPRTDTWWVALSLKHWGEKLHRSHDRGKTWEEVPPPKYPAGTEVKPGIAATVKLIWALAHGGWDRPGHLYLGTEPGGLFRSTDGGDSFQLVESLWAHPSRRKHWFGGGRNHAGIHSIVVDPRNSDHVYVGVSCAGVFETRDGGQSWQARNQGLRADYLPDPWVEVGHDPHLLLACEQQPDILWQQNHCGVFLSQDGGIQWQDVTDVDNFTRYGFALAIDPEAPQRAWVIPAISDEMRVALHRALKVFRTDDGGQSWQAFTHGLPQEHAYDIVYRHGLVRYGQTLAFGTTTGNLFLSSDDGESWTCLSHFLPTINALCFA